MSPPKPTILILGAGSNIGSAIATHFASLDFKVYTVSRSAPENPDSTASEDGIIRLKHDLSFPSQVTSTFETIQAQTGAGPSVVVYNAAAFTMPDSYAPGYPFNVPTTQFVNDLKVNTLGVYVALQEFTTRLSTLPTFEGVTNSFVFIGNILPWSPLAIGTTLGTGKSAAAHLITLGEKYNGKGARYYFASEVTEKGRPVGSTPNAKAHAKFVEDLVKKEVVSSEEWEANLRFVKDDDDGDVGYKIYKEEK